MRNSPRVNDVIGSSSIDSLPVGRTHKKPEQQDDCAVENEVT
jgi:hypothetical protein